MRGRTDRWTEEDVETLLAQGRVREVVITKPPADPAGSVSPRNTPLKSGDRHSGREKLQPERESHFLGRILALAKQSGWLCYHTHRSDRSAPGFPDLCLTNGDRLIFAELKTATGKVTAEQNTWLGLLRHTGRVEVYLWRPADWDTIVSTLGQVPVTRGFALPHNHWHAEVGHLQAACGKQLTASEGVTTFPEGITCGDCQAWYRRI